MPWSAMHYFYKNTIPYLTWMYVFSSFNYLIYTEKRHRCVTLHLPIFTFVQFLSIISSDISFHSIISGKEGSPQESNNHLFVNCTCSFLWPLDYLYLFVCYWRILQKQISYKIDDVANVHLSNMKKTFEDIKN